MLLNTAIFVWFLGVGVFCGAWAAIQNLANNVNQLGLFAGEFILLRVAVMNHLYHLQIHAC